MIRIKYFVTLLFIIMSATSTAQKLTVESFTLASNDITASSQQRLDGNGEPGF